MQRVDKENFRGKKTALVLSGGVVKAAAWHLGVALALEELGFTLKNNNSKESDFTIDTYVGSSAGALISLYFSSGYKPSEIIEAFIKGSSTRLQPVTYKDMLSFKKPKLFPPKGNYDPFEEFPTIIRKFLTPVLSMSGLFTTQGLHDYILKNLDSYKSFEEMTADLFVVATQLDHSRKVIFSKYNYPNPSHDSTACYYTNIPVAEAVTASMSVPPFYSPYPIKNPVTGETDYYIDGEIRETLSTHVAIDNGCEFILSSWTHTPYHFHDEIGSLINYGLPAICIQAIYLMIQKKIVANRARRNLSADIIDTVSQYMKDNKFEDVHRKKILSILERKLDYKKNVHLIDIYPKHNNFNIFFKNSFSLSPKKTSELVTAGFKRTLEIFRHHEWES